MSHSQQPEATPLVVAGSFGFGNAGDEAVPLAIADLASELGFNVSVDVLSRFDEPATRDVIGLGAQDTVRRRALLDRVVLLSGGGVVEPRSRAVLTRLAPWLRQARPIDAMLYAAAVESGVSYGWRSRSGLKRHLRQLRRLCVRDVRSAAALGQLTSRSVEIIGDSVLWLRPDAQLPEALAAVDRYVAVSLAPRWSEDAGWREWISGQLVEIGQALDVGIVFVPCSSEFDDDRVEHAAVAKLMRQRDPDRRIVELDDIDSPRSICAVFGRSILTIGMRLHACVMAYAQQTPCVGLVYHPKLLGFAETVGVERFFLPGQPPRVQSDQAYGFSFADTHLAETDLLRCAQTALESTSFERLAGFKESLAHVLGEVLRRAGAARTKPAVGAET